MQERSKPDRSELEAIVEQAEANAPPPRAAAGGDQKLRAIRQRAASTIPLDALLPADGVDELDRLRREHDAELRRVAGDAKQRAVERSEVARQRLDALIESERAALATAADDWRNPWVPSWPPVYFIRSTPGGALVDTHIEDAHSWAKWRCTAPDLSGTTEKLSFYHLWQNTEDGLVLADISVALGLLGHCETSAEGMGVPAGWFWSEHSELDVSARLTILPLWIANAATPPAHTIPFASLDADAGVFGDSDGTSVETALLVRTARYAVPAGAFILIEASIVVEHSGAADVDFASGDFRVDCPRCFVTVPVPQMAVNP